MMKEMIASDSHDEPFSLKPIMVAAIEEAFAWALADSCISPPEDLSDEETQRYNKRKAEIVVGINCVTPEELASADIGALARNVAIRLMGPGNFTVNGVYSGNASTQKMVDACFCRPNQDPLADIVMDLGLGPQNENRDEG